MAEFELTMQRDAPGRDQQIRDLFATLGGSMTTAQFARECIEYGIWSDVEQDRIIIRAAQSEIRRALKVEDAAGLPTAGKTTDTDDDGAPVWKARQLWLFEDYELNILDLVGQRDELHGNALKLAVECEVRYGRAPMVTGI